jgi:tetratricopeptide (TPR) repeat protein
MDTLYDLLGALPRDDAEELRAAFRRAVKGAHPDLNPGDPLAGQKFREIVRANEILADEEQRAAYDHLLDLAHKEQRQQLTATAMHKAATSVIALAAVAGVGLGLYIAIQLMPDSAGTLQRLAQIVIARPADFAGITAPAEAKPRLAEVAEARADTAPTEPKVVQTIVVEPPAPVKQDMPMIAPAASTPAGIVPVAATPPAEPDTPPPAAVGPPLELTPGDAKGYRERGIFAYRSGDLDGAVADFDRAIQLDPKFSAAYIDRGIVLYRLQKFERAFADIAQAKRIEKANRSKAAQAAKKKPPQAMAYGFPPFFQRRTAKLE